MRLKIVYTAYFKLKPRSQWRWASTSYASTHLDAIKNALGVKAGYKNCHDFKIVPGEPAERDIPSFR